MIEPGFTLAEKLASIILNYSKDKKWLKMLLPAIIASMLTGVITFGLSETKVSLDQIDPASITAIVITYLLLLSSTLITTIYRYKQTKERLVKIRDVETRLQANPKETQAAWDLAQIKLELYLNRNLDQVRSIYLLVMITMCIGFAIVGYGVIMIYQSPTNINASIVTSVAGILLNFIGATILNVYKSTMSQATQYVSI